MLKITLNVPKILKIALNVVQALTDTLEMIMHYLTQLTVEITEVLAQTFVSCNELIW